MGAEWKVAARVVKDFPHRKARLAEARERAEADRRRFRRLQHLESVKKLLELDDEEVWRQEREIETITQIVSSIPDPLQGSIIKLRMQGKSCVAVCMRLEISESWENECFRLACEYLYPLFVEAGILKGRS